MEEWVKRHFRNERTGEVQTLAGLPPLLCISSFEHGRGWVPLGPEVWLYPERRLDKLSSPAEVVAMRREAEARGEAQAQVAPVTPAPALVEAETPLTPEEEARGAVARQMVAQREGYSSER